MKLTLTKDLAPLREAATTRVNAFAERVRQRFVTPGEVQQQVYRQKLDEAQALTAALNAGTTPVPADYPLLSAEVGITAQDLHQVSQVILNTAALWAGIAAQIESGRYLARDAIAIAPSPAAIMAAETAARTTLDVFRPPSSATP